MSKLKQGQLSHCPLGTVVTPNRSDRRAGRIPPTPICEVWTNSVSCNTVPVFTLLSYPCNYVDTLATLPYPCNVVLPAPAQSLIVGPRSRGKRELNERSNLGHVH